MRSNTGKIHLADGDGAPRCGVRSNQLERQEGELGDVSCSRCAKLAAEEAGVPTPPPVMPSASTSTPSITRGWEQRSADAHAAAAVDEDAGGPLGPVRRLLAPIGFATLGSVGVIWMLRRRRKHR